MLRAAVAALFLILCGAPAYGVCTWDPGNHGTNITLSNGNLTWTSTNSGGVSGRGTFGYLAGTGATKASLFEYYEVTIATPGSSTVGAEVGITNASEIFTHFVGESSNSASFDVPSGDIFYTGSVFGTYTAQIGGTTYGVAVDFLHQKVWWTINGTTWNNGVIGSQNPATNTGGFGPSNTFQPGGTFSTVYPAFGSRSSGPSATANFGATTFAYSIPSGFSAWCAAPAVGAGANFFQTTP